MMPTSMPQTRQTRHYNAANDYPEQGDGGLTWFPRDGGQAWPPNPLPSSSPSEHWGPWEPEQAS